MELRVLEAFASVVSTGSVTAAAYLLERAQPAIGRALQKSGKDLGFQPFTRRRPRVTPTELGFQLYGEVDSVLQEQHCIQDRATALGRHLGHAISDVCF